MHETDLSYSVKPADLAARFGQRAIELLHQGKDAAETARLAATFAIQADPSLGPGLVIEAREAFTGRAVPAVETTARGSICVACGWLVQQHFDRRNRAIGCDGARRINEAFLQRD